MRESSVNKFYTDQINKYFGFVPKSDFNSFDLILESSISHKWKHIHPSYLSSKEALVLGIKILNSHNEICDYKDHDAHEMFDLALSDFPTENEEGGLYYLAMGIFYFRKSLQVTERKKQIKVIRLAKHYVDEAISIRGNCLLSRLHLVLIHVALGNISMGVKELVKLGREIQDQNIYHILFRIYENLGHANIALFYSLKATRIEGIGLRAA